MDFEELQGRVGQKMTAARIYAVLPEKLARNETMDLAVDTPMWPKKNPELGRQRSDLRIRWRPDPGTRYSEVTATIVLDKSLKCQQEIQLLASQHFTTADLGQSYNEATGERTITAKCSDVQPETPAWILLGPLTESD